MWTMQCRWSKPPGSGGCDLRAVSFDRGFHSPENRVRLDELLDHNVLPTKSFLNIDEPERGERFVATRGQHLAEGSAINNFEHRKIDRVLTYVATGFGRVVLSMVAPNIHPIGLLPRRKARRRAG